MRLVFGDVRKIVEACNYDIGVTPYKVRDC